MEEQLQREIDTLMSSHCGNVCPTRFASKKDVEDLEAFTKTRASEKTSNLFIGLVITLIIVLLGAGGTNYMMYANTNERVAKIEIQLQGLDKSLNESKETLKDIETLLRQRP